MIKSAREKRDTLKARIRRLVRGDDGKLSRRERKEQDRKAKQRLKSFRGRHLRDRAAILAMQCAPLKSWFGEVKHRADQGRSKHEHFLQTRGIVYGGNRETSSERRRRLRRRAA